MKSSVIQRFHRTAAMAALAAALAGGACADQTTPLAPDTSTDAAQFATLPEAAGLDQALAELRSATARYHNVEAALADGFIPLGVCEEDDSALPYINPGRIDGTLDYSQPEALLYAPGPNGQLNLVAVELVVPYALWTATAPPAFFGVTFQREDEFGVFGLHLWIWSHNPDGMFAARNPRVSCESAS
jgi:hypothetical protein